MELQLHKGQRGRQPPGMFEQVRESLPCGYLGGHLRWGQSQCKGPEAGSAPATGKTGSRRPQRGMCSGFKGASQPA